VSPDIAHRCSPSWLHLALAQKSGGVLKMPDFASPASMSIHEEVTRAAVTVLMPVFNNLVLFDQHKEKNSLDTIVPDLAESWTWSEDGKELIFKLRQGVKWHDGKPFTAADVKCTWDLLQGSRSRLRNGPSGGGSHSGSSTAARGSPTETSYWRISKQKSSRTRRLRNLDQRRRSILRDASQSGSAGPCHITLACARAGRGTRHVLEIRGFRGAVLQVRIRLPPAKSHERTIRRPGAALHSVSGVEPLSCRWPSYYASG
jgi:hypothetical protein